MAYRNMMAQMGQVPRWPPPARRARIGDILISDGDVDPAELARSLALQSRSRARIGDILVARGIADRTRVAAAAARQMGVGFADLDLHAPDPLALIGADIESCLRERHMPFRRDDRGVIFASRSIAGGGVSLDGGRRVLADARTLLAEDRAIQARLIQTFGPALATRAALRRPVETSHRGGTAWWQRGALASCALIAAVLVGWSPDLLVAALMAVAGVTVALNGLLWAAALIWGRVATAEPASGRKPRHPGGTPPKVTILIPLYQEPEAAQMIVRSVAALEYPPELLDIKFILEAGDDATLAAFRALTLPPFADVLIAPKGAPQTKPRALNFALDFADGDIIGIYDAEDHPAPDQIRRIVAQFAAADPRTACIQARLGYYNAAENWLTRCFEIEYASWFDVMLPGLARMGLPLPLGGTSLFIRRQALEDIGGWDSHNVTEDADLGMMLARHGLRTELSASLTQEEATSTVSGWVRQRSRWLKGYLVTWMTHMRRPLKLWRALGPVGFAGFHLVLLSAVTGYLALPLLWLAAICPPCLGTDPQGLIAATHLGATWAGLFCLPVLVSAAWFGLRRRRGTAAWPWIAMLPAYWVLGSLAAYLALWELLVAPSKWRKTRHGLGRIAGGLCAEARKSGGAN